MHSVVKAKGSKMVILKNVQERKFNSILLRISEALIEPAQRDLVKFERYLAFFQLYTVPCHVLLWCSLRDIWR